MPKGGQGRPCAKYNERKVERMANKTPQYIKTLLKPNGTKPAGRRVWSIDLESVWLPFFTATNTMGETAIPHDALGAPLRLAYNGDGSVKFSKSGRPVIKVAKDVQDNVRMVRENFVATLQAYAHGVAKENPDGYKTEIEASAKAGLPIVEKDKEALETAIRLQSEAMAEAKAEAEASPEQAPEREAVGVA
jgi:hypothetical protein